MTTYHLHGDCEECQRDGHVAEYVVHVPSSAELAVDPQVNVCAGCIDPARRRLESEPYAAGFAQVDALNYARGAA